MKSYNKPEIQIVELNTENSIMYVSDPNKQVGINDSYDDNFAAPRRGSSWEEYEN